MKNYSIIDENDFLLFAAPSIECPENGVPELLTDNFLKPKFDRETRSFYEGATSEEVAESKREQVESIDLSYTNIISDLMRKSIEKLAAEQIPIPQSVLDERNALRAQCNLEIDALGIDVSIYRDSNRETLMMK